MLACPAGAARGFSSRDRPNGMFMPERIDHHGWRLALLAAAVAAIPDPKRLRAGSCSGSPGAVARDRTRMIVYLALAGIAMVRSGSPARRRSRSPARLCPVAQCRRGSVVLIFASYDNRAPVCDALSPVSLYDAVLGGALMSACVAVAGRLETPAVLALWPARSSPARGDVGHSACRSPSISGPRRHGCAISYVEEARPVYPPRLARRDADRGASGDGHDRMAAALPGCGGRDPDLLRRIIGVAAPCFAASLLLLWQTRPALPRRCWRSRRRGARLARFPLVLALEIFGVRVAGAVAVVVIGAGAIVPFVLHFIPEAKAKPEICGDWPRR